MNFLRENDVGCVPAVRVQPGAQSTAIVGIYGEGRTAALKISIHAAPIEGRANEALIGFLTNALGFRNPQSK